MNITFLQTRRISEDGHTLRLCEQGQSYDVADTAARMAINAGWARASKHDDACTFELVNTLGLRVQYGIFLNDRRNPCISFEAWKAQRRVPTNPATHRTIGTEGI